MVSWWEKGRREDKQASILTTLKPIWTQVEHVWINKTVAQRLKLGIFSFSCTSRIKFSNYTILGCILKQININLVISLEEAKNSEVHYSLMPEHQRGDLQVVKDKGVLVGTSHRKSLNDNGCTAFKVHYCSRWVLFVLSSSTVMSTKSHPTELFWLVKKLA